MELGRVDEAAVRRSAQTFGLRYCAVTELQPDAGALQVTAGKAVAYRPSYTSFTVCRLFRKKRGR